MGAVVSFVVAIMTLSNPLRHGELIFGLELLSLRQGVALSRARATGWRSVLLALRQGAAPPPNGSSLLCRRYA